MEERQLYRVCQRREQFSDGSIPHSRNSQWCVKENRQPVGLIAAYFSLNSSARIENRRPVADRPTLISNPALSLSSVTSRRTIVRLTRCGVENDFYACRVQDPDSINDRLKMFLSNYLKVLDIYHSSFMVKSC